MRVRDWGLGLAVDGPGRAPAACRGMRVRDWALGLGCWLLALGLLFAQEGPEKKEGAAAEHSASSAEHKGGEEHSEAPSELWKWANFAMLAGVLGYLIGKNAG